LLFDHFLLLIIFTLQFKKRTQQKQNLIKIKKYEKY
jgi:hypothetical protein